MNQYPTNHPNFQGLVVLKNGATIENAREGFTNWKPNDWNSIGGVIQVQGSHCQVGGVFLNCRRAAGFVAYQNFSPGNPSILRPNLSYFRFANFVVNDEYRGVDDFFSHVSMWQVDGIEFMACHFENAQSNIAQSSKLGTGINSIDASYKAIGHCTYPLQYGETCPENKLDRGSFVGFDQGIQALGGGANGYGFTVDQQMFVNNVIGIYANAAPTTITRNKFIIGGRNVELDNVFDLSSAEAHHRGVFTQGSESFRIEDNIFQPAPAVVALGTNAILVANSRSNNVRVYNNQAFGMSQGYIGEGQCNDPNAAATIGLQFLCNKNNGNDYNFIARPNPQSTSGNDAIRAQQGSNSKPAGNTFDQNLGLPSSSDFANNAYETPLNYWWQIGTRTEPVDITPGWVGKTLSSGPNSWCVSKFVTREIRLDPAAEATLKVDFSDAKLAYVNTSYVYNTLLDGGNTDGLIREVQETWPQEAWELRANLLGKSPFLSTNVLKEMIEKHIMPQAMEFEICLANPEATKKDGFIKWAEFESTFPMPSYMIDLIAGSWEGKTFRMQLEAEIAQHHAEMSEAAQLLQASYAVNQDSIPLYSMLEVWQNMPNYGARYAEAGIHIRQKDFDAADALIRSLGDTYPLTGREEEQQRTLWYIDQLRNLASTGRKITQMDSTEVNAWIEFALRGNDTPGNWAANALCYHFNICIGREGNGGGIQKALRPQKAKPNTVEQSVLTLYPNPASTWAAMNYHFNSKPEHAEVRVLDVHGRIVHSMALSAVDGQLVWDIRAIQPGVYSVQILLDGSQIDAKQLVIQAPGR